MGCDGTSDLSQCEHLPQVLELDALIWTVEISYTYLPADIIRGVKNNLEQKYFIEVKQTV